jgi:DNA-binding transcriptional MerR regulator
MYTIKAVSVASGVSIETLRAWERRYGVVQPKRDASGRRSYQPADVLRLKKLREATQNGHAISKLAKLSDDQLNSTALLAQNAEALENNAPAFAQRMLKAAENYQPDHCDHALSMAMALLPVREVIKQVISPVLKNVGERWHQGTFTIGQERIVSQSIEKHVTIALDNYNRITSGTPMVFATLGSERHEFGILMSALLAASHGLRCVYIGPEIPAEDLAVLVTRVNARALVMSFVFNKSANNQRELKKLLALCPSELPIWAGGSESASLTAGIVDKRLVVINNFDRYEQELTLLATQKN